MSGSYVAGLSSVYPVLAYDLENSLFFISNARSSELGFGFISRPLSGGDESISDRLEVFLNSDFPVNTRVQFSLMGSPAIERLLSENTATAVSLPRDSFLRSILENKNEFLREGAKKPLPHMACPVRNFLLLITVTVPISGVKPDEGDITRVSTLRIALSEVLKTAGIRAEPLGDSMFLEALTPVPMPPGPDPELRLIPRFSFAISFWTMTPAFGFFRIIWRSGGTTLIPSP